MIKLGSSDIDTIKIGTTNVDSIMLNGVQIYPTDVEPPLLPLTGDAKEFLAAVPHTSTNSGYTITMEDQDESKIYPYGQRIYVGGWNMANNKYQEYADNGFTIAGPHGGVAGTSNLSNASNTLCPDGHKMMYTPLITEKNSTSGGDAAKLSCYVDGNARSGECTGMDLGCYVCSDRGYDNQYDCENAGEVWYKLTVIGQAGVNGFATGGMQRWMDVDNDNIYGWSYNLDDCRTYVNDDHSNAVYAAMESYDSSRSPSWVNGGRVVGDFGLLASYYPNSTATRKRMEEITWTLSQMYYGGGDFVGDGDGFYKSRAMIGEWSRQIDSMCDLVPSNNNKPRLLTQGWLWGFNWNVVPDQNSSPDYFESEFLHDSLLAMMTGSNGLVWYQTRPPTSENPQYQDRLPCVDEWNLKNTALLKIMKLLNVDNDILKALVWGQRTSHQHSISYTPGPIQKCGNDSEYSTDALTVEDIQFEGKRYIVCVNSQQREEVTTWWNANPDGVVTNQNNPAASVCPDNRQTWSADTSPYIHWYQNEAPTTYGVTTTLSGFHLPDGTGEEQLEVREIVSDTIITPNAQGEIEITLAPLESAVFIVQPGPGYEGGDTPEVQLPFSSTDAAFQSWANGITGSATLSDVQPDDARISNRTRGEFFAYETAAYLVFYCQPGKNINANFDMQGFANICTVDDYLGGNYPGIAVGVAQSIAFNDSGNMGGMIYTKTS